MLEWAKKPLDQIVNELRQPVGYERGKDEAWHQFELNLLENTPEYIHVGVSVDDGSFLWSSAPKSSSFIVHRDGRTEV